MTKPARAEYTEAVRLRYVAAAREPRVGQYHISVVVYLQPASAPANRRSSVRRMSVSRQTPPSRITRLMAAVKQEIPTDFET